MGNAVAEGNGVQPESLIKVAGKSARTIRMTDDEKTNALMRRLATISSVGTEMAAPVIIGVLMDWWLNTMPWFTIALTVLGFVGGVYHLILLNRPRR